MIHGPLHGNFVFSCVFQEKKPLVVCKIRRSTEDRADTIQVYKTMHDIVRCDNSERGQMRWNKKRPRNVMSVAGVNITKEVKARTRKMNRKVRRQLVQRKKDGPSLAADLCDYTVSSAAAVCS